MNSALDNPNQMALKAFPLDLLKYLEMAVAPVWIINPWPEKRNKNIPTNNIKMLLIIEKKIDETNKIAITMKE